MTISERNDADLRHQRGTHDDPSQGDACVAPTVSGHGDGRSTSVKWSCAQAEPIPDRQGHFTLPCEDGTSMLRQSVGRISAA